MLFGMVSGVGRGMGVLDGEGVYVDCRRGMGSFGGEFGASHCGSSQITLDRTCFHIGLQYIPYVLLQA